MKIYTRTGDTGETSLFSGRRVRKTDARVHAYGTVDELNSFLGLARAQGVPAQADDWLEVVQNELFTVGADLATPTDASPEWLTRLTDAPISRLEGEIDVMDADLPPLKNFILPAGVPAAAALHVARTVCRRAERECVDALDGGIAINPQVIVYLNRLSDWLFTLARWVNAQAGESETRWSLRGS
ncbi:MAG: cob(I)yrinic acid a,c-diamide adenosyltransferase [Anaerolineae bacterium]|nr:cob(I)yrinic acid a,c-diamide adenosyltransferase [Anaerolineae bacterium]NUQ02953.1 cob(I)yrinic acid a,c-diamide adenosyltransferase [Anaerolineae bacterium]